MQLAGRVPSWEAQEADTRAPPAPGASSGQRGEPLPEPQRAARGGRVGQQPPVPGTQFFMKSGEVYFEGIESKSIFTQNFSLGGGISISEGLFSLQNCLP